MQADSFLTELPGKPYQCRRGRFNPWVRKIPWRRKWQPTSVFLKGESHGQRSLVGSVLEVTKESETTEQLNNKFAHISWEKAL